MVAGLFINPAKLHLEQMIFLIVQDNPVAINLLHRHGEFIEAALRVLQRNRAVIGREINPLN